MIVRALRSSQIVGSGKHARPFRMNPFTVDRNWNVFNADNPLELQSSSASADNSARDLDSLIERLWPDVLVLHEYVRGLSRVTLVEELTAIGRLSLVGAETAGTTVRDIAHSAGGVVNKAPNVFANFGRRF